MNQPVYTINRSEVENITLKLIKKQFHVISGTGHTEKLFHNMMRKTSAFKYNEFSFIYQHWLTELEILAMVFAAAIHDYEHTGTTNNFHIQTR